MKLVPLGEVAQVNPKPPRIRGDAEVSFVGMADLNATVARTEGDTLRQFSDVSKGYTVFENGDILVAKITPCFENNKIGQAQLQRTVGVGSTEFHVIRPGEHLDDRYLLHFLRQDRIRRQGELRMTGSAGQRRVPPDFLRHLEIPLPPPDGQRRIAVILDQADALRAKRHEALTAFDSLASSLFYDMFGDPVLNPKGWKVVRFEDQIETMQYGPRFYNESYSTRGIRIVRITDLDQHGRLEFDSMPTMEVSDVDQQKFCLRPGDIVFARTGATVGKLALIRPKDPPCIAGAYFIRIQLSGEVEPDYGAAVLRAPAIQSIIVAGSRQSAQQNFSGPGVRALPLPLPPLELQRQFSVTLAALEGRRTLALEAEAAAEQLFASLQSRAFSGQL